MNKNLKIVLTIFAIVLSFFLGVKYSKAVKEHAGWMFEGSADEIELPDLSDTQNPEGQRLDGSSAVDENGKTLDQATPPAEDSNIVPSIEEGTETPQEATPAAAPAAKSAPATAAKPAKK